MCVVLCFINGQIQISPQVSSTGIHVHLIGKVQNYTLYSNHQKLTLSWNYPNEFWHPYGFFIFSIWSFQSIVTSRSYANYQGYPVMQNYKMKVVVIVNIRGMSVQCGCTGSKLFFKYNQFFPAWNSIFVFLPVQSRR